MFKMFQWIMHLKESFRISFTKNNHPLVLNIKMVEKPKSESEKQPEITKLAIGKPGGAQLEETEYNIFYQLKCLICKKDLDNEQLHGLINSIKQADSAFRKNQICEWELQIEPCEHTLSLQQQKPPQNYSLSYCFSCDLSANLWLCLTCGHIGCGRKNYDGSGGNNHAIDHFQNTIHPIVVKLGTITPEGNASIYCYACNNDVSDPNLVNRLLFYGINVNDQQKTEKSVIEMNLDLNKNLMLSSIIEEGRKLLPLKGPGFTGMVNLGNSCYINSVFQVLFAFQEFQNSFNMNLDHVNNCQKLPAQCLVCQLAKLGQGLASGEYLDGVKINDLRYLIGKDHPEFKTQQMQDALEYLQYVFELIGKENKEISKIFEFIQVNKLKCTSCGGVKIAEYITNEIKLPVIKPNIKDLQQNKQDSKQLEDPEYDVQFSVCFDQLVQGDFVDSHCSFCGKMQQFKSNFYLKTVPKYLIMPTERLYLENWVPKKLNANIKMDIELNIGSIWKPNIIEQGEKVLDDQNKDDVQVDNQALQQLLEMGFGENRCKRALIKHKNNVENAMNYLFEKIDDSSLDLPIISKKQNQLIPNQEGVDLLTSMGFNFDQIVLAMKKYNNNVELTLDALSNGEYFIEEEQEQKQQNNNSKLNAGITINDINQCQYKLKAAIIHLGKSVHAGHYICYIKKDNQWVYYNDEKVAQAVEPFLGKGYIYIYEKQN
ncbi:ubiquitin, putative [Ichthyophthirius multifiliis]|uniref:ubiquitinyl hydrolase 1 n=1 Tax=Ichthyophthirius multifiliis TaxID=5932 RepID=G0QQQ6_ICHMU|nr:ubiquitin, putative [Ichthyophthirius multifiliis]EGR32448.1 ubiquitin, putative [Ichthyophthirius multifiliis]|eukprot:XP_004036434.1 ubiquitin, putative [Ichthyophthirius multifiliis]